MDYSNLSVVGECCPDLISSETLSKYNFAINDIFVSVPVSYYSYYLSQYQFLFVDNENPVKEDGDKMGEIRLASGTVDLVSDRLEKEHYGWSASQTVVLMPKTELSMATGLWHCEEDIKFNIYQSFLKYPESRSSDPRFSYPATVDDVDVLTVEGRQWGHTLCGDFNSRDFFVTELTKDLVLLIDFEASPTKFRNDYEPEPVKQHLMKFYLEYLSHVRIIPVGSVLDADLPPLGFYPAEREEKAIDAEGRVVESKPDSDSSETTMGW